MGETGKLRPSRIEPINVNIILCHWLLPHAIVIAIWLIICVVQCSSTLSFTSNVGNALSACSSLLPTFVLVGSGQARLTSSVLDRMVGLRHEPHLSIATNCPKLLPPIHHRYCRQTRLHTSRQLHLLPRSDRHKDKILIRIMQRQHDWKPRPHLDMVEAYLPKSKKARNQARVHTDKQSTIFVELSATVTEIDFKWCRQGL